MTNELKNFLESDVDIYKDVPKDALELIKPKIKNNEFFQLIVSLSTPDIKWHQDYLEACENPEWTSANGKLVTEEERDRCRELHGNTLKRYINYLKILIKTNGFETDKY